MCEDNEYGLLPPSYSGDISVTISGRSCQPWSWDYPHQLWHRPENPDDAQNYCRDPYGDPYGAWCYTMDPNKRWDYCSCTPRFIADLI